MTATYSLILFWFSSPPQYHFSDGREIMTLDWQVVFIAILAVLLRVCVLLAKPNSEEFEGSGGSAETFPTGAQSLTER
jgi:hypothetical protein